VIIGQLLNDMIVSIHQPNFMPWLPFFKKIEMVDKFIILQNCQFEKNNFQNRFNIGDKWYTLSVNKGLEPIVNKKYVKPTDDWLRIKNNLKEYKNVLNVFDDCISESLCETNSNIIKKICNILDIKTEILFDYLTDLKSTERLVDICLKNGATEYVAGSSGRKYMDLKLFDDQNIKVTFQTTNKEDMVPIIEVLKKLL